MAVTTRSGHASLLLQQLEVEEARGLAAVLARCPRQRLAAGASLAACELDTAAFLVVEAGTAAVTAPGAGGRRRVTLAIAGPGDVLLPPREGEELTALVEASVTLLTPLAYRSVLARPTAAAVLVERLTETVRDREASLAAFAAVEHVDRVREKLLQLARVHGRVTCAGVQLDLPLTHQLIAQTVGSARETVTWAIRELSRQGFLVRKGRRYLLTVPPEALQAL